MGELLTRLQCAWQVLRGRPLLYRVRVAGDVHVQDRRNVPKIAECRFVAADRRVLDTPSDRNWSKQENG